MKVYEVYILAQMTSASKMASLNSKCVQRLVWVQRYSIISYLLRAFALHLVETGTFMQVAMDCAAEAGCEDNIIKFVLPLGTTVNMNGTALYEATTVIFIAQVKCQLLLYTLSKEELFQLCRRSNKVAASHSLSALHPQYACAED